MIRIAVEHIKPGRKSGKRLATALVRSIRGGVQIASVDPALSHEGNDELISALLNTASAAQPYIESEQAIADGDEPEEHQ